MRAGGEGGEWGGVGWWQSRKLGTSVSGGGAVAKMEKVGPPFVTSQRGNLFKDSPLVLGSNLIWAVQKKLINLIDFKDTDCIFFLNSSRRNLI